MNLILEDACKLNVQSLGALREFLLLSEVFVIGSISQPRKLNHTIHPLNLINLDTALHIHLGSTCTYVAEKGSLCASTRTVLMATSHISSNMVRAPGLFHMVQSLAA